MAKITQSESRTYFDKYFEYQKKKILEEGSSTIFENLTDNSIEVLREPNYKLFQESEYYKKFLDSKEYNKIKTINDFLIQETFSNVFSKVKYLLLQENDYSLSFNEQFIIENTEMVFGVKDKVQKELYLSEITESVQLPKEIELLEEMSFGTVLNSNIVKVATLLSVGSIVGWITAAMTIGIVSIFSLFLLSSSSIRKHNQSMKDLFGTFGEVLFGTSNFIKFAGGLYDKLDGVESKGASKLDVSEKLIAEFDNISNDKEMVQLMTKLQKSNDKNIPNLLTEIFTNSCIDDDNLPSELGSVVKSGKEKVNPQKLNTIHKMIYAYKTKVEDDSKDYDKFLEHRKCLINKLSEFYKMIAIANLSNIKNKKQIGNILKQGNYKNPEKSLELYDMQDEEALNDILKENIKNVFKLRMHIDDIIKDLKKGAFHSDTEAGKHFELIIKQADREVSDQLGRSSYHPLGKLYEDDEDNTSKDNELEGTMKKRKLFGFNTK